ncbi:hypothetical protein [Streptomyces sp. NPDC053048]|uniref:hypothetical protein n=1 Tax=Streptomyces sp. NPDC053048 TaxID=3365694 RepID=UPI0037CE0C1D
MTEEHRAEIAVRLLKKALELLASDAEAQTRYVHHLRIDPDEMALEFDDAFRRVVGLSDMGLLPDSVLTTVLPIDEHLQRMTGSRPEVWTVAGLQNSPDWQELRSLAKEAMEDISAMEV